MPGCNAPMFGWRPFVGQIMAWCRISHSLYVPAGKTLVFLFLEAFSWFQKPIEAIKSQSKCDDIFIMFIASTQHDGDDWLIG